MKKPRGQAAKPVLSPIRILEGTAKGRQLWSVPHYDVRPALARVRNSVFNILRGQFEERPVADLYAGTGSVGFEALSRGASLCVFVERSREVLEVLRLNADKLGLAARTVILARDVVHCAADLAAAVQGAACLFVDPPYALWDSAEERAALAGLVADVVSRGVLAPDGLVVIEHRAGDLGPGPFAGLTRVDRRAYGQTEVSLYRR